MRRLILCLAALGALLAAPSGVAARPAPAWATFGAAQPVTILGYADHAMEPFLSRDGAILFFNNRNDPPEQTDLLDGSPGCAKPPLRAARPDRRDQRLCRGAHLLPGRPRALFPPARGRPFHDLAGRPLRVA